MRLTDGKKRNLEDWKRTTKGDTKKKLEAEERKLGDVQKLLEHTLGIPPDTDFMVLEVLNQLQSYIKGLSNKALRRSKLLCTKQADGDPFSDFYLRLTNLAEEVDQCSGDPLTCAKTQIKMVVLMGFRDEKLIQRLISMDTRASLQVVVNCCHFYEATQSTASAIHSSPSHLCTISSYKGIIVRRRRILYIRLQFHDIASSLQLPTPLQLKVDPASFVHACMAQESAPLLRAPVTIVAAWVIGPMPPSALPRMPSAIFVARQDTMTSATERG
ncbi:hypothetical protein SK128_025383 [Halocaridina rubra]|uniref:Uncharacterized protein n=1 Tax=Halocaridina rubra TaxID=373956 RepID=A0AAN9A3J1_HALRR